MSVRRFDLEAGDRPFAFLGETEPKIDFWLAKYPEDKKRSAVIPLLWLAQKDNGGWLSEPAMRVVADRLEMPYIRVYEVATFYTMFRLQPVGVHHVQLCGTTPCMLRGANDLKAVCEAKIGPKMALGADGKLSWEEVECLGACVNAPMVQINDYYYEDLTPESLSEILDKLVNGVAVEPGNFVDRVNSEPIGGTDVLTEAGLFDGSLAKPLASIPNAPGSEAGVEPEATAQPDRPAPTNKARETAPTPAANEGEKPDALEVAANERDDLKRISGVGPKIEETLNGLGIYTYAQIAAWTGENVKWVDDYLSFRGRIDRENWIEQAKTLAGGGETDFAKRVGSGDVASSQEDDET